MTILELEQRTELERATIRYYEKTGLIAPNRKENTYRDYSEEDLQEILKIKLLRQLDLPIYQIKELQQGSAELGSVLRQHSALLAQRAAVTEQAAEICKQISETAASYQSLNAAEYLEKINTPSGNEAVSAEELRKRAVRNREYHPVRRYAARIVDYTIVSLTFRFLLICVLRIRPFEDWMSTLIEFGSIFLSVPLMALSISKFGTTPGKWMMGLHVEALSGRHLLFRHALEREWNVLRYGFGFNIPFWSYWRQFKSYREYKDWRYLEYDTRVDYIYTYWYVRRKAVFAIVCALIIAMNGINVVDAMKPRYRGNDITVAEFAENFNFYWQVTKEDSALRMAPDGTWTSSQPNNNNVGSGTTGVVNLGGTSQNKTTYDFHTEGERLSRITYSNTWTDFMLWTMPDSLINTCITAVMSQRGVGIGDLKEFTELMSEQLDTDSGNITYENVTIQWTIKATGCTQSGSKFYATESGKTPTVTLQFELIIN